MICPVSSRGPVVILTLGISLSVFPAFPISAAPDPALTRMALCRDSWLDWSRSEPAKFEAFRGSFMRAFARHGDDAYFVPRGPVSVAGLKVLDAYPQSVGMGVGFSLTVEATFERALAAVEKAAGRALGHCETGDGMRSCELAIAQKRTLMVMADDTPDGRRALIGCYYYYEK